MTYTFRRPRPVVRTSWSCPLCGTKTVIHLEPRSYSEQIEHCRTCQAMVVLVTTFVPQVTVLRVEEEALKFFDDQNRAREITA